MTFSRTQIIGPAPLHPQSGFLLFGPAFNICWMYICMVSLHYNHTIRTGSSMGISILGVNDTHTITQPH